MSQSISCAVKSSWIDEAGAGETEDIADLWARVLREVEACDRLVLYVEADDFPLKGALIEVGAALAPPTEPTRIERFQSLQPVRYWRARQAIPEKGIEANEVLLLQSLRFADDRPHTVILRPHPSKIGTQTYLKIPQKNGQVKETWFRHDEHRFRVPEFLDKFEFEPDHERVRRTEVAQIQGRISELQSELVEAQHDPARLAGYIGEGLREETGPPDDEKGAEDEDATSPTSRDPASQAPAAAVPATPTTESTDLVSVSRGDARLRTRGRGQCRASPGAAPGRCDPEGEVVFALSISE